MAIALSQDDYFALWQENAAGQPAASYAPDITWKYPPQMGHGFMREIYLRDGLCLALVDYQSHEDIFIHSADREHPLPLAPQPSRLRLKLVLRIRLVSSKLESQSGSDTALSHQSVGHYSLLHVRLFVGGLRNLSSCS